MTKNRLQWNYHNRVVDLVVVEVLLEVVGKLLQVAKQGKEVAPKKTNFLSDEVPKVLESIAEDESSDYDFTNEISNSSQSTWDDMN